MASLQSKILDAIKAVAAKHGFEVRFVQDFINVGKGFIQPPGSFTSALVLSYDFQTDSATLGFKQEDGTLVHSARILYMEGNTTQRTLSWLDGYLKPKAIKSKKP